MLRTGRTISIDGTQIAFSEWGNPQGTPVVLIHGWLFSRTVFERQEQGELAERCRVVAYDLRGHGESGTPEDLSAYSDGNVWAADLDAVRKAVGMARPILSGWSLGGRVAAHYVFVNGPESVAGLNFVAARFLQKGAHGEPVIKEFIGNCSNESSQLDKFLGAALSVPPVARRGAIAWHRDYGTFFDEMKLPVLVTHGERDAITPPAAAETIARRLHGKLSIYSNCGHMPFWENPERFNRELVDFAEFADS